MIYISIYLSSTDLAGPKCTVAVDPFIVPAVQQPPRVIRRTITHHFAQKTDPGVRDTAVLVPILEGAVKNSFRGYQTGQRVAHFGGGWFDRGVFQRATP